MLVPYDGKKIKELRLKRKLSSKELAIRAKDKMGTRDIDDADFSASTIWRWENQRVKTVNLQHLKAVAQVLRVPLSTIMIIHEDEKIEYQKYFDSISRLYDKEFDELKQGYWKEIDLLECEIDSTQNKRMRKSISVINLIESCDNKNTNAVVLGPSGSGKSYMSLKLFRELKENYLQSKSSQKKIRIPLFIELSLIGNQSLEKILMEKISVKRYECDIDRYVIFCDGLNEVVNINTQQLVFGQLVRFGKLNPNTRLIITTQTADQCVENISNFLLFEMLPLKKNIIIDYLTKSSKIFNSKKDATVYFLDMSGIVQKFFSMPIFLSIIVKLFNNGTIINIRNPGRLYQEYEKFLCGARETRPRLDENIHHHLLPFIAFNMCINNWKWISYNDFNKLVYKNRANNYSTISESDARDILVNRYQILKKNDAGEVAFIHETVRDFFSAIYFKNNEFSVNKIMDYVYSDSNFQITIFNALKYYVGIVDANISGALVNKFIDKNLFYACELFSWSSIEDYKHKCVIKIINLLEQEPLIMDYPILNLILFYNLKVLNLLKDAKKDNHPVAIRFYLRMGLTYSKGFIENLARKNFKKAHSILKKYRTPDHLDYATYYMMLGLNHRMKWECDDAIKYFRKALNIFEKNDSQKLNKALCKMQIGSAYWKKLESENAIKSFETSLNIFEDINMQEYIGYAQCNMRLGVVYCHRYKFDNALNCFRKAVFVFEKNDMAEYPEFALCNLELGHILCENEKYDDALNCIEKSISIFKKLGLRKHQYYAKCQMNLGAVYFKMLDFENSETCYKKALSIFKNNGMKNEYAMCKMGLGNIFFDKTEFETSEACFKVALSIFEENKWESTPEYALCNSKLGILHFDKFDNDNAIKYFKKANFIFKKTGWVVLPDYAPHVMMLGLAYLENDDYTNAKKCIGQAFLIFARWEQYLQGLEIIYGYISQNTDIFKREDVVIVLGEALIKFIKSMDEYHPDFDRCWENYLEITSILFNEDFNM
jgi:tetratricopeptide (TPR) repeat protein/transcriptional regulator with XRE-family HTH domain